MQRFQPKQENEQKGTKYLFIKQPDDKENVKKETFVIEPTSELQMLVLLLVPNISNWKLSIHIKAYIGIFDSGSRTKSIQAS
ncbi:hypothetical protein [Undibacterium sp. Ji22W]|uniref:hypothetical protein n=1 Tax=Undibacterium sp. Ji22W TaxID=3413038 RepID=UPI003BF3106B